jgi:hypothetical protein
MITNGNDNKDTKAPALLSLLHEQWEKGGKKKPSTKEEDALLKAWKDAGKVRDAAEAAFRASVKAESDACAAIVKARGKGRLRIAGVTYVPMSRGETVYFRTEGGGEVESFGSK